jgi:hypothetical protein
MQRHCEAVIRVYAGLGAMTGQRGMDYTPSLHTAACDSHRAIEPVDSACVVSGCREQGFRRL